MSSSLDLGFRKIAFEFQGIVLEFAIALVGGPRVGGGAQQRW